MLHISRWLRTVPVLKPGRTIRKVETSLVIFSNFLEFVGHIPGSERRRSVDHDTSAPYNQRSQPTTDGSQPNLRTAKFSRSTELEPAKLSKPEGQNSDSSHFVRSTKHRMNRTLVVATVLATGLATSSLFAQDAAPAAAPATTQSAPAAKPEAIPAKIAVIAFEQVAGGTNEGQKMVADLRKKYEARNTELQTRASEVDSLKKQLQALPANTPDDQRSTLIKNIDTRDRKLQADAQELQQEEQSDFQEGFGKLMQKVGPVAVKYASENGFTALMNTSSGQNELPTMLWWNASTDISQAVVTAYNAQSSVAAPAASTPSAPRPHTAPTHTTTTPKK
jgi:Skp family chaperone for outer membrane proteins